jgi:hypothetical protein
MTLKFGDKELIQNVLFNTTPIRLSKYYVVQHILGCDWMIFMKYSIG